MTRSKILAVNDDAQKVILLIILANKCLSAVIWFLNPKVIPLVGEIDKCK